MESSALVKLLVTDELGGELVLGMLRTADQPATSMVTYPECRVAIAAALRGRRLDASQAQLAVAKLDELWLSVDRVPVSDMLVRQAGDLAARHWLRGFDSIHLASVLEIGSNVILASWDRDLLRAARAEGLATVPRSDSQQPGR